MIRMTNAQNDKWVLSRRWNGGGGQNNARSADCPRPSSCDRAVAASRSLSSKPHKHNGERERRNNNRFLLSHKIEMVLNMHDRYTGADGVVARSAVQNKAIRA